MITRIEANRYRCPSAQGAEGHYDVIAGTVASGKSALLGIVGLLGDPVRLRRVSQATAEAQRAGKTRRTGTLLELLHRQDGDRIFFVVEANLSSNHVGALAGTDPAGLVMPVPTRLRHAARVDVGRRTFEITDDSMLLINGRRDRLSDEFFGAAALGEASEKDALEPKVRQLVAARQQHWGTCLTPGATPQETETSPFKISPDRLSPDNIPAGAGSFPDAPWFAQLLPEEVASPTSNWEALQYPASPNNPEQLGRPGQNIRRLVLALQEDDTHQSAAWGDHVRVEPPQVNTVGAVGCEAGQCAPVEVDYGRGHRVASTGLSESTPMLMPLALLPLLDEARPPKLPPTEEPEKSVYRRAIEAMIQLLYPHNRSQVRAPAHSPDVTRNNPLEAVSVARLNGGCSTIVAPGEDCHRLCDQPGSLGNESLYAA
ncbi:hypothetical protein [Actinomadura sp. BRA 177]|uniref:hypothetical protein n=1 Tax=Actinomadura sp. BRA 177 TaxID=2745202 RepID=UPI00159545D1|nr:hypothetical protein [Actinomadura sp. BRA 177]NVI90931.1 hypothetical protein [Actinomadura sp. BRA 177]